MNIFLDIETIPTERQDVRDYIAAGISPPGNLSKAETIAKWNEESRPSAIEDAVNKTGLDGAFGRVCVACFAIDDEPVERISSATNEVGLLTALAIRLDQEVSTGLFTTVIVGHNVSAFDLRFLMQRYMVNGIKPPPVITRAAQAKPWEVEKVFDTMMQWAGVGGRVSLDKLCLALGIESPKGEIDGSKVGQYVRDGKIAEVVEYCVKDVEATREIWRRMTFQMVGAVELEDVPA